MKDLQLKVYRKSKRHLISEATKKKRLARSRVLLRLLRAGTAGPICWSDEKVFTVQPHFNTQTDRVLGSNINSIPLHHRSVFRRQKPASVMVWAGVMSDGKKLPLIFIDMGVKINRWKYKSMLEDVVAPWLQETYPDSPYVFQQDGALAHTSRIVQAFRKENFHTFWTKDMWPPSSPDLNPMDFSI